MGGLVKEPKQTIVSEPNPFKAEVAKAKALLDSEIASTQGWEGELLLQRRELHADRDIHRIRKREVRR